MAKDHKFFAGNGGTFNKHFTISNAAAPVVRALLRVGVDKINTSHRSEAKGRSIKITPTVTGLEVEARGDGLCQTVYAVTDDPVTVAEFLKRKFRELIVT